MESFIVTFGQSHAHSANGKTFDKDCVAEIFAGDMTEAWLLAEEHFGNKFCRMYTLGHFKSSGKKAYFPRGIIALNNSGVEDEYTRLSI